MRTTFDDAWKIANEIDGWLLERQGRALFEAAGRVPGGASAVEIGSHRGKSAVLIAMGLPEGVRLTAVDPFDDPRWGGGPESLTLFQSNLEKAGVSGRVDLFKGLSEEASAQWAGLPVGFLWVDGAHDLESTLKDFDGWMPHLKRGAELYVHDAFSAVGTTRAILRRFWFSENVRYVGSERTLAKFMVEPLTLRQRLISTIGIASQLPFFSRMVAIKLARRRGLHGLERRFMREDNEPLI
jgi:predicted O-methyltransferase YrrM